LRSKNSIERQYALRKLCESSDAESRLKWTSKMVKSKKSLDTEVYNLYVQALLDNQMYEKAIQASDTYLAMEDLSRNEKSWFEYCKALSILKSTYEEKSFYDFQDDFVRYFLTQTFYSQYHDLFLSEIADQDFSYKKYLEYRQLVNKRDYRRALELFDENFEESFDLLQASCPEISDLGRCLLFGASSSFAEYASKFEKAASSSSDSRKSYYLNFYAGRFYDKIYDRKSAGKNFQLCLKNSFSDSSYDDALWYYLKGLKNESESAFLKGFAEYGDKFNNKHNFMDLMEDVFVSMLSNRRWTSFCNLYEIVNSYCDKVTSSSFNYIFARLLEEEMVDAANWPELTSSSLFQSVIDNPESPTYYLMLSAERLDLSSMDAVQYIFERRPFEDTDPQIRQEVLQLMKACLKKRNIKQLYYFYSKYKKYVSSDDLIYFVEKTARLAEKQAKFYPYVLRLASSATYSRGGGKSLELLEYYYPQYYKKSIRSACKKYGLDEDLLFGLIHSESFFDKDVVSRSGAIGLCQLMDSTASDVARKLKIQDYDLRSPSLNIEFGSFYLAELIRRLDGSVMDAIISYNSGITRVRKWHKKYNNVPIDIFIEMLPYAESRGYGKKVLSASAIYGYLYYSKSTHEIISSLVR
ncbi:MAG: lytic transglycosylase domain-containing protein, partial [Treponemataceae bacterium]|nr:lytic transglycosylase domain-containing protein [Treponemataceae bacterium]